MTFFAARGLAGVRAGLDTETAEAQCLPAMTYTDPGVLAREHRACFEAGWIGVGFAQQLAAPGDVRPVTVAGRSLLLVRDRAGSIRVFHNVCRHRGLRLVEEPRSCAGVITCPYHRWSYALEGSLSAAPYWDGRPDSAPEEALRADLSLLPVRSAVWSDIIFVNLAGEAPPLDEFLAPLSERWRDIDMSLLRLLEVQDYRVAANWKFVSENFLDSYHLPWVHPQLGEPETAYRIEPTQLSDDIFGFIMPEFEAAAAEEEPYLPVFPKLPPAFRHALDLVYVFPNTMLLLNPSWLQVIIAMPDEPAATREMLGAFLVGDAAVGEAYADARGEFAALLRAVNEQDIEILERMQRGRAGDASDRGRFASRWDGLGHQFFRRVARVYEDEAAR